LKQIALGIFMYKQDYDETLPRTRSGYSEISPSNPYAWADMMQPYLKSTQLFQCPSETNSPNTVVGATGTAPDVVRPGYSDYFMNTATQGISDATLASPSLTVLLGDSDSGNSNNKFDGCSYDYADQSYLPVGSACATAQSYIINLGSAGRHLDGANYAFADGHVKWLKGSIIGGGSSINGNTAIGNSLYPTTNGKATFSVS
jgi:prepilin-type processing-associated H-X9-DG protein